MRLSADPKSEYYSKLSNVAKVYIDSVLNSDCLEVDTVEGYAIVYARDKQGNLVIDKNTMELKLAPIHGKIEIEVPEEYEKFLQ